MVAQTIDDEFQPDKLFTAIKSFTLDFFVLINIICYQYN